MSTPDAFANLTPQQRQQMIEQLQGAQAAQAVHVPSFLEKLITLGHALPVSHLLNPADVTAVISAFAAHVEHGDEILDAALEQGADAVARILGDDKTSAAVAAGTQSTPEPAASASPAGTQGPVLATPGHGDQIVPGQVEPGTPLTVDNASAVAAAATDPATPTPQVSPPAAADESTVVSGVPGEPTLAELYQLIQSQQAEIGRLQSATVTTEPAETDPEPGA